jgi:hypothetical protein
MAELARALYLHWEIRYVRPYSRMSVRSPLIRQARTGETYQGDISSPKDKGKVSQLAGNR